MHGLSRDSKTMEVRAVRSRLELERETDGLDADNIVEGGRGARAARSGPAGGYAQFGGGEEEGEEEEEEEEGEGEGEGEGQGKGKGKGTGKGKGKGKENGKRKGKEEESGSGSDDGGESSGLEDSD